MCIFFGGGRSPIRFGKNRFVILLSTMESGGPVRRGAWVLPDSPTSTTNRIVVLFVHILLPLFFLSKSRPLAASNFKMTFLDLNFRKFSGSPLGENRDSWYFWLTTWANIDHCSLLFSSVIVLITGTRSR
jgi:hypothetical protein